MALTDSLASKLKMPMRAGGSQGAKKTVDEELDEQFGGTDEKEFDPKMKLGDASVEELQAALEVAKKKGKDGKDEPTEEGEESAEEDEDEDEGPTAGGSSGGTY